MWMVLDLFSIKPMGELAIQLKNILGWVGKEMCNFLENLVFLSEMWKNLSSFFWGNVVFFSNFSEMSHKNVAFLLRNVLKFSGFGVILA